MATKSSSVALNIGSQRVAMAAFAGGASGSLVLKSYDSRILGGDPSIDTTRVPQVKMAVADLITSLKTKGGAVRYAVASHPVFTRFVKLPPLSADKVDQIVEFEAQQNVPFPIDEVVWGFQLIGEPGSGEVECLLAAVKSDELNAINQAVEGSGLHTVSVDVAPILIYNAFRYCYADVLEPVLVIDLGERTTNLIYVEGEKVFISTSRIGGSNISSAIAKEFDMSYEDAENWKIQQGQVALGGNYAPPEDERVASMANVARSTLTRLHGEIVRTNNRYRSQQGGEPPQRIFLAGRGANLPYVAEFIAEKFNLPVEFFNALRNVSVGPKINPEAVASEAHCMGELVGLALRNKEGCPIELELVPGAVARARDVEKRKPALITAVVGLVGVLAAAAFFFYQAKNKTNSKLAEIAAEESELDGINRRIQASAGNLATVRAQTKPYVDTLSRRVRWVDILNDIGSCIPDSLTWISVLEPVTDNKTFTKPIVKDAAVGGISVPKPSSDSDTSRGRGAAEETKASIDMIKIQGLYRENPKGVQVVYDFLESLKKNSKYLNLADKETKDYVPLAEDPSGAEKWAWVFQMELPLKDKIVVE